MADKYEPNNDILRLVNREINLRQVAGEATSERRGHLGASVIGHPCARKPWYDFRWATDVKLDARILRLFDRGIKEEPRFLEWLAMIGVEARPYREMLLYHAESDAYLFHPWDVEYSIELDDVTGDAWHMRRATIRGMKIKQWGFKQHNGHFSGSCDAKLRNVPGVEKYGLAPDTWILGEFKTHQSKTFTMVKQARDLRKSMESHYIQMVVYMHYIELPLGLYCAVDKQTDDLYFELIEPNPEYVRGLDPNILQAIFARTPPDRISKSPSWYECKFCDHSRACHFGEPLQKSCRTCIHGTPATHGDDGVWHCAKWGRDIPKLAERVGCPHWKQIDD